MFRQAIRDHVTASLPQGLNTSNDANNSEIHSDMHPIQPATFDHPRTTLDSAPVSYQQQTSSRMFNSTGHSSNELSLGPAQVGSQLGTFMTTDSSYFTEDPPPYPSELSIIDNRQRMLPDFPLNPAPILDGRELADAFSPGELVTDENGAVYWRAWRLDHSD